MPILSITPISGNSCDYDVQTGTVKRTRKLLVRTAPERSPTEGTEVWPDMLAIEQALVDFGYTLYPVVPYWVDDLGMEDRFSLLHTLKIEQSSDMGEPGFWVVTIEYDQWNIANRFVSPLAQPPEISWSFEQQELPALFDTQNQPIVNSAGDPFLPAITIKYATPILEVIRNEATFDPLVASTYIDHVNSDTFLGCAPNTVLLRDVRAQRVKSIYGYYTRLQYQFAFNFMTNDVGDPIGWQAYVLDAGLNEIVSSTRVPILLSGNTPAMEPLPLDGSGSALALDGTPVYKTFNTYPIVDFNSLGITLT